MDEKGKIILTKYRGDGGAVTLPQRDDIGPYDVGDKAFSYCEKLSEVVIPSSVTRIGERAFFRCLSLRTASVGSGVKETGESAFSFARP